MLPQIVVGTTLYCLLAERRRTRLFDGMFAERNSHTFLPRNVTVTCTRYVTSYIKRSHFYVVFISDSLLRIYLYKRRSTRLILFVVHARALLLIFQKFVHIFTQITFACSVIPCSSVCILQLSLPSMCFVVSTTFFLSFVFILVFGGKNNLFKYSKILKNNHSSMLKNTEEITGN